MTLDIKDPQDQPLGWVDLLEQPQRQQALNEMPVICNADPAALATVFKAEGYFDDHDGYIGLLNLAGPQPTFHWFAHREGRWWPTGTSSSNLGAPYSSL